MKLYSTNNPKHVVSIREAVIHSLPPDNGLYMPQRIPSLSSHTINNLHSYSFVEIATQVALAYLRDDVSESIIEDIVKDAINFPAPLITIENRLSILELFHGPTLAFKDFGARFMARLMNHFWAKEADKLTILVATSGDTGGAVASGFYGLENIEVVILYPGGKVSGLQEKQLTTWGKNIKALEVNGDFDDCQKMVKQAFLDPGLNELLNLSSANSINIARLIPQSFYYFEALKQLKSGTQVTFCVPSGNFGNLTAGLFAKQMGLPIKHMIAATNVNDIVPRYLESGQYIPTTAHPTLSNAMDIGNPSNFSRIMDLYSSTWNNVRTEISGYSFNDIETVNEILNTHKRDGYVMDPHTAVGVLAARQYQSHHSDNEHTIVLSTAHPIKFETELKDKISFNIPYPGTIYSFYDKESKKTKISNEFSQLKKFLLQ